MPRYAYRTPGVYFEWLDTRMPALVPLRTDIAGFVGIAARGPLHRPVKVESWTQFTSTFGGHLPQGYLAYAVEGFFANGGQICWVVRVADPDLARPARFDLLDGNGWPTLRLNACSPGVWGQDVTVSVARIGNDRFSLTLQLQDGGQELWRNVTMRLAHLDLLDDTDPGQPTLRLEVFNPDLYDEVTTVSVSRLVQDRFTLTLWVSGRRRERWPNLTMDPTDARYVEEVLNDPETGSGLVTVRDLNSRAESLENTPRPRTPNLRESTRRLEADPRYVETVLNDPETGSHLVTVENLGSPVRFPDNTPSPRAPNLLSATGRLDGGWDGLAPSLELLDRTRRPTLRLSATSPRVGGQSVAVSVKRNGKNRFSLIVRPPGGGPEEEWKNLTMRSLGIDLLDGTGEPTLSVIASAFVIPGQSLWVSVMAVDGNRFSLTVRVSNVGAEESDGRKEEWPELTMDQNDPRYVETVLNDPNKGSRLVTVRDLGSPAGFPANTPDPRAPNLHEGSIRLKADPRYVETVLNDPQNGSDLISVRDLGSPARFPDNTPDPQASNLRDSGGRLAGGLKPAHLSGEGAPPDQTWGLATLEAVDEVSMVVIPDIMPKSVEEVQRAERRVRCQVLGGVPPLPPAPERKPEFPPAFSDETILALQHKLVGHCEKLKDRVAILDTPPTDTTPGAVIAWRNQFDTKYAALYFPWLKAPDPVHPDELLRAIPPSGHVAGAYARGDLTVGVHKPPANEALAAVRDVVVSVDDIFHGELNVNHINAVRVYNGRGVRIAGARTLSSDSEWRYVNVCRLLIMIEEWVDEQMQWTVFEPNNPALWRDVDRVVRSFLDGLWRRGRLDGATAQEAYHVRCDEATNPPQETDQGRMICEIGVLPPWPAEFVIVRIGITEGGTEIIE